MSERVYIVSKIARDADVYHTRESCLSLGRSDPAEITARTARLHDLRECSVCATDLTRPKAGLARTLDEMDPDDVLGGSA